MKKFLLVMLLFSAGLFAQEQIIKKGNVRYLANKIIVKFKSTPDQAILESIKVPTGSKKQLMKIGTVSIKQTMQNLKPEAKNYSDLERTYAIEYASPFDPQDLAKKLSKSPEIEWAEPWYVYEVSLSPNDPQFTDGTQWYLNKISAEQAWELSTGSGEIVIAIDDTGVDWNHPDLAANIWNNSDEIPNNGIDDDNNGYIDDTRGWDFGGDDGTPDNDPMEDSPTHGTYIAGLASAVTNNGQGIASIGYNCKIMPVKASQHILADGTNGDRYINYGREGIIYAANNGADVINCSWGGSPYSQALQETIDYATSLGALVISSADNENTIEPAYPSSYHGVLSVGGTDQNDERYSSSNYGPTVDVVAPATGAMYSTWQDDTYRSGLSGTSLAAPIAAGLAGLVFQKFSNYTPLQVAEQIRVNTDNIDALNPAYKYYLGTGRINASKTLSNTNSISIRAEEFVFTDLSNGNGITEPGENFTLGLDFKNYLNPASNVTVTLESRSEYVTITQNSFTISSVRTLEETNNFSSPFVFTVAEDIPVNQDVELLFKFSNGSGYVDFQLIRTKFNTTYLTQDGNDIALTITSKGNLGYNDFGSSPSEGDGLTFAGGENLLYEGALMYGNSPTMVMDAAHISNDAGFSNDFKTLVPFGLNVPGEDADYEGYTKFNDKGVSPNMGIETELFSYSFSEEKYSKFIILRYNFSNTTDTVINNFYAGLFFDLDFNNYYNDHTSWDYDDNFGYAYDQDKDDASRIYDHIGVALLSGTEYNYRAMNTADLNQLGGVSVYPQFDSDDKWAAISSKMVVDDHGPDDIAFSVSGGPYTIQPHNNINVSFAIAGGKSLDELRTAVQSSREAYGLIPTDIKEHNDELPIKFSLSQNYPNPFNPTTTIRFSIPNSRQGGQTQLSTLKVYDILGREIKTLINKSLSPGSYEVNFNASGLSSGVYFYKLSAGSFVETKKMMLLR